MSEPEILFYRGKEKIGSFSLCEKGKKITVGRSELCDVQLSADDVSREHLYVLWDWNNAVVVADLESENGVTVNGSPCDQPTEITYRDIVKAGSVTLVVAKSAPQSHEIQTPAKKSEQETDKTGTFLLAAGTIFIFAAAILGLYIVFH